MFCWPTQNQAACEFLELDGSLPWTFMPGPDRKGCSVAVKSGSLVGRREYEPYLRRATLPGTVHQV